MQREGGIQSPGWPFGTAAAPALCCFNVVGESWDCRRIGGTISDCRDSCALQLASFPMAQDEYSPAHGDVRGTQAVLVGWAASLGKDVRDLLRSSVAAHSAMLQ